jgi:hypothetical protein
LPQYQAFLAPTQALKPELAYSQIPAAVLPPELRPPFELAAQEMWSIFAQAIRLLLAQFADDLAADGRARAQFPVSQQQPGPRFVRIVHRYPRVA